MSQPSPNIASDSSRPSSPSHCAICLEKLSTQKARLMPCAHDFDTACIKTLQETPNLAWECPLCRGPTTQILYTLPFSNEYGRHSRDGVNADTMTGPFLKPHEELTSSMTEAERNHVLEVRRLGKQSDYAIPQLGLVRGPLQALEGTTLVTVEKCHELSIEQFDRDTLSILIRKLGIRTEKFDKKSKRLVLDKLQYPGEVKRAKQTFELLMGRIGKLELEAIGDLTINLPTIYLVGDEKGLNVSVDKSLRISNQGNEVIAEITTILHEHLPGKLASIDEVKAKDLVYGNRVEREERERVVRLAREEMQSALDFVQKECEEILTLEKVTTGILDVGNGGECELCNGRERNGECWISPE